MPKEPRYFNDDGSPRRGRPPGTRYPYVLYCRVSDDIMKAIERHARVKDKADVIRDALALGLKIQGKKPSGKLVIQSRKDLDLAFEHFRREIKYGRCDGCPACD